MEVIDHKAEKEELKLENGFEKTKLKLTSTRLKSVITCKKENSFMERIKCKRNAPNSIWKDL